MQLNIIFINLMQLFIITATVVNDESKISLRYEILFYA